MKAISSVFKAVGFLGGAAYWLLCLLGFGAMGGGWFLAAFFLPPLDVFYPVAQKMDKGFWPVGLILIGVGSLVSLIIAVATDPEPSSSY